MTEVVYPIEMSFEDFSGPIKVMDSVLPTHHQKAMAWQPGEVLCEHKGYTLHRAVYSLHPESHAKVVERRGEAVIARIGGVTVGGLREKYVWVAEQHSKVEDLHLASEMGIEWFKLVRKLGTDWRLTPESRQKHGPEEITMPGLKFRVRQYRTMVERGILSLPEGVELPTLETAVPRSQRATVNTQAWIRGRRVRLLGQWRDA